MKLALVTAVILVLSSSVQADPTQELHAEHCQTPEVMELIQDGGSCRIIVSSKKTQTKGSCTGVFMGSLLCEVSFSSLHFSSWISLACRDSTEDIVFSQELSSVAMRYTFASLIQTQEGDNLVRISPWEYQVFSNELVKISLIKKEENDRSTLSGKVSISLQNRNIPLTNVSCKN